jgi:6-phosphogluconolactonase
MKTFESKKDLEKALCDQLINDLSVAIKEKNSATLLLSGGSTPLGLYQLLSDQLIDWSKVTVGLVDERFVSKTNDFSNEKLLFSTLFSNKAKESVFIPMIYDLNNRLENLKKVQTAYSIFKDPDVVLLGMGEDGHTASIFPFDLNSELSFETTDIIVSTQAPKEPIQRISCSPTLLNTTKNCYLMITGLKKKMILETAVDLKLPIGHFIPRIKEIYYTEKEL